MDIWEAELLGTVVEVDGGAISIKLTEVCGVEVDWFTEEVYLEEDERGNEGGRHESFASKITFCIFCYKIIVGLTGNSRSSAPTYCPKSSNASCLLTFETISSKP